jgi:uncharacterized phage-associated protein
MHEEVLCSNDQSLHVCAVDVAQYILDRRGPMDALKLQKICYYAQVWSLVWVRGLMFPEDIEAWEDGPIVRSLYACHRGLYTVTNVNGNADLVKQDPVRVATIESVLEFYAARSGHELGELTRMEDPWVVTWAKAQSALGSPQRPVIELPVIATFYSTQMRQALK